MFFPAAVVKLNQYVGNEQFQRMMEEIEAAQLEGLSEFEVDVKLLAEDEISDVIMALDVCGYTTVFNQDTFLIEVQYDG